MRINVDDEVAELTEWYADDPSFVRGACWALSRVAGIPADVIERRVTGRSVQPAGVAAPLTPAQPEPVLSPPPAPAVPELGIYPGIGPITSLAAPLTPADMTQPPTPPSEDSMAAAFERAQAAGDPLVLPMDPETLAEVEAELGLARRGDEPANA